MNLVTIGLEPGAYPNWFVVFNNPAECEAPIPALGASCGLGDLGNAAVEPSVLSGGCPPNICEDVQAAAHVPPGILSRCICISVITTQSLHQASFCFVLAQHKMGDFLVIP